MEDGPVTSRKWRSEKLEEKSVETGARGELLRSVRRLTRIVLDRLEQGSVGGTLDQGQVRMLGSIALRSLRLWKETLGSEVAEKEQNGLEA